MSKACICINSCAAAAGTKCSRKIGVSFKCDVVRRFGAYTYVRIYFPPLKLPEGDNESAQALGCTPMHVCRQTGRQVDRGTMELGIKLLPG